MKSGTSKAGTNLVGVVSLSGVVILFGILALMASCGGGVRIAVNNGMGSATVSISDPPSCSVPQGSFKHVFITVRSVQAHISATADDGAAGWQELAPQLASRPVQIDLFAAPQTSCVLAQLGSTTSLPVGSYQQIRLMLLSNSPGASDPLPLSNACAGNGFNCVVLADDTIHELELSSQANTGLKIPPGQIVGGPIQVTAGQSVDINIDFNACASIVRQGNGLFRLKPTLTASQVSPNNSGISGQIVDSLTNHPIAGGKVLVALEQTGQGGIDRILMQAATDSSGNFNFCPLPTGTYDVVAVAVGANNLPYNATALLNVPNGTRISSIPLVAETGATTPAVIQGVVTATTGTSPASVDVAMSALQTITLSGGATRQLTIPLESIQATATTPAQDSTPIISVQSNTSCPSGSPANANCASYILVVPASNPSVGAFSTSNISFAAPAAGDVLFTVDSLAFKPLGGGIPSCTPPEQMTTKNSLDQPLKVTAGTTVDAKRIDFSGCS